MCCCCNSVRLLFQFSAHQTRHTWCVQRDQSGHSVQSWRPDCTSLSRWVHAWMCQQRLSNKTVRLVFTKPWVYREVEEVLFLFFQSMWLFAESSASRQEHIDLLSRVVWSPTPVNGVIIASSVSPLIDLCQPIRRCCSVWRFNTRRCPAGTATRRPQGASMICLRTPRNMSTSLRSKWECLVRLNPLINRLMNLLI